MAIHVHVRSRRWLVERVIEPAGGGSARLKLACADDDRPALFQAPFHAGIAIDTYQTEPLGKALRLPRHCRWPSRALSGARPMTDTVLDAPAAAPR